MTFELRRYEMDGVMLDLGSDVNILNKILGVDGKAKLGLVPNSTQDGQPK
jgi:hypothetical protein